MVENNYLFLGKSHAVSIVSLMTYKTLFLGDTNYLIADYLFPHWVTTGYLVVFE